MRRTILVLMLLLPLGAAVRYVDNGHPDTDDGNTGIETAPWETIQHAADQAGPGDTVYVKTGTYKPFAVKSSGTPGNRIVFAADPDDEYDVIVNGSGVAVRGGIMCDGQSHIEIRGFHVKRCTTDGIYLQGSVEGDSDIVVAGNRIDTTGNAGIYAAGLVMGQTIGVDEYRLFDIVIEDNEVTRTNQPEGKNECISVGGGLDGFVIRHNWVHDSDQYGIDAKFGAVNGKIYGNHIHGMEKHGIYLDCASRRIRNVKVYGNDIHDNNNGIVLAREVSRLPEMPNLHDVDIYNNLVYDNRQYGIMAYKYKDDYDTGLFDNIKIINNTVFRNVKDGIRLTGIIDWATNFTAANNIAYQNTPDINNQIGATEAANLTGTDPLFVSTGTTPDLHLQAGSPAIGMADAAYAPDTDFDGTERPQGMDSDAGAFEYRGNGIKVHYPLSNFQLPVSTTVKNQLYDLNGRPVPGMMEPPSGIYLQRDGCGVITLVLNR